MPRPTTPNVLRIFREAFDTERADGREWYRRAHTLAEELARVEWQRGGVQTDERGDVERAAAVIAVLSPRQSWDRNVALARQAYRLATLAQHKGPYTAGLAIRETLPTLTRQREQVARLLVDREDPDDVVSGPKVRAFWRTIADPTDPRAVVVDRHAIDVACGAVLDDATRGRILGRKGGYDTVSRCYARAAKIITAETGEAWSPAEVQAVTWTVWRRAHARHTAANIAHRRTITATV